VGWLESSEMEAEMRILVTRISGARGSQTKGESLRLSTAGWLCVREKANFLSLLSPYFLFSLPPAYPPKRTSFPCLSPGQTQLYLTFPPLFQFSFFITGTHGPILSWTGREGKQKGNPLLTSPFPNRNSIPFPSEQVSEAGSAHFPL